LFGIPLCCPAVSLLTALLRLGCRLAGLSNSAGALMEGVRARHCDEPGVVFLVVGRTELAPDAGELKQLEKLS
jgi:hypothetical protein